MDGDTELGDIFAQHNLLTNEESSNNDSNVENIDESNPLSDKEAESRFISWYEEICKERMTMLETEENHKNKIKELEETEERYKKRIKELDENSTALLQAFEQTQVETNLLRKKYEPTEDGDAAYHEPYRDIAKDRDRLLNAEKEYKQRIENLEAEVATLRKYVKDFESIPQLKNTPKQRQSKVSHKTEKIVVITGDEYIAAIEKENVALRHKLGEFERGIVQSEVSKKEITKTKNKATKSTSSVLTDGSVKREEAKSVISKRYSPPFFPKIPSASSGSLDDDRSTSVTSLNRTTQTPRLLFGLGYHQIYSKKGFKRKDGECKNMSKNSG